ncbi:helix-turn-helix transcriptional regulator [Streptomyces sp. NBC_00414]|uniref:response regulator transcription factor n=1 Tax=Streptomyces sp. NBC_00414 TaxID=2975739 RepID=UPI002E1F6578
MTAQSSQLSLSSREREILVRICDGETYHAIARGLGISPHTVDTHIRRIRHKTGIFNRSQLVLLAVRLGLCQPDQ